MLEPFQLEKVRSLQTSPEKNGKRAKLWRALFFCSARAVMTRCWPILGFMQAHLGPMLGQFSVIWGCLRAILGLCCFFFGLSWAYVGPSRRHLGAMLGPPGPMLAHHGAILGPPGPYIGPTLSHLGSVLANPAPS